MSKAKNLKTEADRLGIRALELVEKRDAAVEKARNQYRDKIHKAVDEAATAQKAWLDAEAAEALLDRPDGEQVAKALGLTLPTSNDG